jgi:hypothetical protein
MRILKDFDCLVEAKTACEEWEAFTSLRNRRWFNRRWVVQEITFARCAMIYCGKTIFGWWDFCEAASLFGSMVNRVKTNFRKDPNIDQHPDRFGIVREFSACKIVELTSNIVNKTDDGPILQRRALWSGWYLPRHHS